MDPIDKVQHLLLQSFSSLSKAYSSLEGDLKVFNELEASILSLPEYEGTLDAKLAALNAQLSQSIPTELEQLGSELTLLKEKRQRLAERYESVTNDFLLNESNN